VVAVVAGLGLFGPVGAHAGAAFDDACTLLTAQQVTSALGIEVDPGHRPNVEDPSFCVWRQRDRPTGVASNVMLNTMDAARFDTWRKNRAGEIVRPLDGGIGDAAYFSDVFGIPSLTVKKGDKCFRVATRKLAIGPGQDAKSIAEDEKAIDKALAQLILNQL
jgi:hypothetical protein